ncbi:MAG: hypothetical protein ACTH30_03580 [Leucobacter sp.]
MTTSVAERRKLTIAAFITGTALVLTLGVSPMANATSGDSRATPVENVHQVGNTDADVFSAVFFGQGKLADELGFLSPTVLPEEAQSDVDHLTQLLEAEHATELSGIRAKLTSGDVRQVTKAAEEGVTLIDQVVRDSGDFEHLFDGSDKTNPLAAIVLGPAIVVVAYAAAVVHNTVAASGLLWWVVGVTKAGWPNAAPYGSGANVYDIDTQDQMLDITKTLRGK